MKWQEANKVRRQLADYYMMDIVSEPTAATRVGWTAEEPRRKLHTP
jgi:hypothetical protein